MQQLRKFILIGNNRICVDEIARYYPANITNDPYRLDWNHEVAVKIFLNSGNEVKMECTSKDQLVDLLEFLDALTMPIQYEYPEDDRTK